MENIFKGTGIALITPFNEDLTVDFEALERIVNHVIDGGADFLVALGTTSEAPTLSAEEKQQVVATIIKVNNGRLPVLLGIGGNNTQAVVDAIKAQDFNGIQGILSVVPYYNKPNQRGMKAHFEAIADASPVPVVVYNVPGRVGVNLQAPTCVELAQHPNIVAVKEASGNLQQIMEILRDKPTDFDVLSGDDGITPEALKLHYAMMRMNQLIFADGNPAGIKCLMNLTGLCKNVLRLPLVPVNEKVQQDIENEYNNNSILK